MFMLDSSPETKSKFADPNYTTDSEAMFREKFSENLQMVEDIITSFGDDADRVEKSQEYSGFQKFLFTSLETLDIDVSDYIGIHFKIFPRSFSSLFMFRRFRN